MIGALFRASSHSLGVKSEPPVACNLQPCQLECIIGFASCRGLPPPYLLAVRVFARRSSSEQLICRFISVSEEIFHRLVRFRDFKRI